MKKRITNIEEVQKICIDIAKETHRILSDNNIPYYIIGGSVLGSVRHGGFIPWDDDMDIGIMRKNYWQSIELLQRELKYPYKCISYINSSLCIQEACKIMDMRTRIREKGAFSEEDEGIYIDLFPIDYSNGKINMFSRYSLVKTLIRIQELRFSNVESRAKSIRILAGFIRIVFFFLTRKNIPNYLRKHLRKEKGKYLINYSGVYGSKELVPYDFFGTPKLMPFENTNFYGVSKPREYLQHIYGDYMKLPPEEKRRIHLVDAEYVE